MRDSIEYKKDYTHWLEAKNKMEEYIKKGVDVVLEGYNACPPNIMTGDIVEVVITTKEELDKEYVGYRGFKTYKEVCQIVKKYKLEAEGDE